METVGSALFSNFATLRPFPGFTSKYQGLDARENPIALPGGLDPRAGQPGYDPALNAGHSVPMGSRLVVWLPRFTQAVYGDPVSTTYQYQFVWRIRTLADQVADGSDRLVGHFGATLNGAPQGASPVPALSDPGPRVVIPAAYQAVQVQATTPATPWPITVQTAAFIVDGIGGSATEYGAPLSPLYPSTYSAPKMAAAAMLSQGLYENGNGTPAPAADNAGFSGGPQYIAVEARALGDELIVLLSKSTGTWDFDTTDDTIALLLGSTYQNIGVYVSTGAFAT